MRLQSKTKNNNQNKSCKPEEKTGEFMQTLADSILKSNKVKCLFYKLKIVRSHFKTEIQLKKEILIFINTVSK